MKSEFVMKKLNEYQKSIIGMSILIFVAYIISVNGILHINFSFSDMLVAILTSSLVIATIFYANETQRMATEMEMSRKRELIEKRLSNLYAPLYFYILRSEQTEGKSDITWSKSIEELGEGKEKEFINEIIVKNSYLASEELQRLLVKIHGFGAYDIKDEDKEKLIILIKKDYEELKKEFFDLKLS